MTYCVISECAGHQGTQTKISAGECGGTQGEDDKGKMYSIMKLFSRDIENIGESMLK